MARIRPAVARDLPALADLAGRTWSDAFGWSVGPEEEAAELGRRRSERYFAGALAEHEILVAEDGGALVGYVQFGDVDIAGVEPAPGDGELHRVYVETGLQSRGLGTELVRAALAHPRLAGARRIFLQVWDVNERAARLYERLGFRIVGTTRFELGSGEVAEDLVMVLERDPEAK